MSITFVLVVLFVLVLIGIGLWFLNTKVAMDSTIKTIINVVVIFLILFWLVKEFAPGIGR